MTPTFHREREVIEAVKSTVAQEGVSIECIVVDDSPEGSARAGIEGLADPRVRYVHRDTPSGSRPAVVRNEGFKLATGRYVCFLDDDDQLLPGSLRAMTTALDENRHVGVAVAKVVSFGDNEEVLRINNAWAHRAAGMAARTAMSRRLAAAALLFGESFTSASVIRREYIQAVGAYDPTIPLYEDVEFYTRAIRRFGHVFVDHPMLYRRTGEPSLTHTGNDTGPAILHAYEVMHRKYRAEYGWLEHATLRAVFKLLKLSGNENGVVLSEST